MTADLRVVPDPGMVPAFCVLPDPGRLDGLFAPDPRRALNRRSAARRAEAANWDWIPKPVIVDDGTNGFDAVSLAAELARRGAKEVELTCLRVDLPAAHVLARECAARGVVPISMHCSGPVGAPIPMEPHVHLLRPSAPVDEVEAVRRLAAAIGPTRVRLRFDPALPVVEGRGGGAAWAAEFGLKDAVLRARVARIVREALPHADFAWRKACALADAGLDPFLAAYARRGLADRNAELLQVVVP